MWARGRLGGRAVSPEGAWPVTGEAAGPELAASEVRLRQRGGQGQRAAMCKAQSSVKRGLERRPPEGTRSCPGRSPLRPQASPRPNFQVSRFTHLQGGSCSPAWQPPQCQTFRECSLHVGGGLCGATPGASAFSDGQRGHVLISVMSRRAPAARPSQERPPAEAGWHLSLGVPGCRNKARFHVE